MLWLLTVAYVLLAVLLLSLNLRSGWPWMIKLMAIMLTTLAYMGTFYSLDQLQGYPVSEALPDRFEMEWALVDEPDKVTGEEGSIYLWIRELDDLKQPVGPPRAYRQSFDEALAERTEEARRVIQGGERVVGFVEIQEAEDASQPGSDGDPGRRSGRDQQRRDFIDFRPVGRVDLPAKSAIVE